MNFVFEHLVEDDDFAILPEVSVKAILRIQLRHAKAIVRKRDAHHVMGREKILPVEL